MGAARVIVLSPEELEELVRRAIRAELDVRPEYLTGEKPKPRVVTEQEIARVRKSLSRFGRGGGA